MTSPTHPPAEQVADLLDAVLPASEAMVVNAHLAQCRDCSDLREALATVTAVLAAEGAEAEPMPTDVAASVQQALSTAAERSHSLEARRRDLVRRRSPRLPLAWLGGAAAAVVLVSAGVAGWQGILDGGNADNSSSSGTVRDDLARGDDAHVPAGSRVEGGAAGSGGSKSRPSTPTTVPSSAVPDITPDEVADRARRLAASGGSASSAYDQVCAVPSGTGPSVVIRWRGSLAVLHVQPGTRTADVVDCRTASRVLFTTGY